MIHEVVGSLDGAFKAFWGRDGGCPYRGGDGDKFPFLFNELRSNELSITFGNSREMFRVIQENYNDKLFSSPPAEKIKGTQGMFEGGSGVEEYLVSRFMAIGVVELFEVVDVNKEKPNSFFEGDHFLQSGIKKALKPTSIEGFCERVLEGHFEQILCVDEKSLPQRGEEFNGVYLGGARGRRKKSRREKNTLDMHRESIAFFVVEKNIGFDKGLSLENLNHRTPQLTEIGAILIYVSQDIVFTGFSYDLACGKACDFLCGRIPEEDGTVLIKDIGTFLELVEKVSHEGRNGHGFSFLLIIGRDVVKHKSR